MPGMRPVASTMEKRSLRVAKALDESVAAGPTTPTKAQHFPVVCCCCESESRLNFVLKYSENTILCFIRNCFATDPGIRSLLIFYDLKRRLTRTTCKSLQETYKIASKILAKTSCQDLTRFLQN